MTLKSLYRRRSFTILLSFLITFGISRLIVFLIESNVHFGPFTYLIVSGVHIHHFTYGIIIWMFTGFISLFVIDKRSRSILFILYGIGLGLIFDESAIWLNLDPYYHQSLSIAAVVIITSLLLISSLVEHHYNVIYNKLTNNTEELKKLKK